MFKGLTTLIVSNKIATAAGTNTELLDEYLGS
jgi:hypothetical protein